MVKMSRFDRESITLDDFRAVRLNHVAAAVREYVRNDPVIDYKRFGGQVKTRWVVLDGVRAPLKTIAARSFEIATDRLPASRSLTTDSFESHLSTLDPRRLTFFRTDAAPENRAQDDEASERATRLADVLARPQQARFRAAVLEAYGYRCAVSGIAVTDALEAAHIKPVKDGGKDTVTNGIALRADLHRLMDAGLMAIQPKTRRICFAPAVAVFYERDVTGKATFPVSRKALPDGEAFSERWLKFVGKYGDA